MLLLINPPIATEKTTGLRVVQFPIVPADPTKFILAEWIATNYVVAAIVLFNWSFALLSKNASKLQVVAT